LVPAGIAIIASTYGLARYAYGLFLPDIRQDLGLGSGALGLVAGSSYAAYLLATLGAAHVASRAGPRLPVILGGLLAAFGMLVMAASSGAWTLLAGAVVAGASPAFALIPMPDAIGRLVAKNLRGRVLTFVNSGASYGVILAGLAALLAGGQWRWTWLAFAGVAVAATVRIARLLPAGKPAADDIVEKTGVGASCARPRRFLSPASARLLFCAFVASLSTHVYWTFAVDLIAGSGSAPGSTGEAFFVLVGASGLVGGLGGDLVRRFGLRPVLLCAAPSLAGSICLLPLASYRWSCAPAVLASGAIFGGAFFVTTGLLVVWSTRVFGGRPSSGLGATLFVVGTGQVVGPSLSGVLAERFGLAFVFYAASMLVLTMLPFAPGNEP
jgi:predicted MFS family arabinose efflux permease